MSATTPLALTAGGRERTGTVVHPDTVAPGAPALLLFHGSTQSVRSFRRMLGPLVDRLADRGVVLAYLEGYRHAWNDARLATDFPAAVEGVDDVAFAAAAVDLLRARFAIDPARVGAFGFSNGGQLVLRLAHEDPERYAGFATAGTTQPTPENFRHYDAPPVPRPLVMFHGTADTVVPYGGGLATPHRGGERGAGLSAPETAAHYAARNGIRSVPVTTRIAEADGSGGLAVEETAYRDGAHPPVVLYTIEGGGHTVPGQAGTVPLAGGVAANLDAAEVVAGFLGF